MPSVGTSAAWSAVPSAAPIAPADATCRNCRRELVINFPSPSKYSLALQPVEGCEERGLSAHVDTAAAAAAERNANGTGHAAAECGGRPKLGEQQAVLDTVAQLLALLSRRAYYRKVDNPALIV